MPYGLSARNTLSTSAPKNPSPKVSPSEEEKKSGGSRLLGGLLLGGFILGGGGLAYNYGYFDSFLKDAKAPVNVTIPKNTEKVPVNQDRPAEKPAPLESIELKAENTAPFESIEPKNEKLVPLESVATETEQSAPPKLAEPDTVKAEPELHPVAPSDESLSIKESVPEGNLQVEPAVSNVKPVEPQSVTQNTEKDSEDDVNKSTADGGESEKLEEIAYDLATVSRKVEEAGPLDGKPQDTVSEIRKV